MLQYCIYTVPLPKRILQISPDSGPIKMLFVFEVTSLLSIYSFVCECVRRMWCEGLYAAALYIPLTRLLPVMSGGVKPPRTLVQNCPNFRDITWNVEENEILHEIFCVVFPATFHVYVYRGKSITFGTVYSKMSVCIADPNYRNSGCGTYKQNKKT